MKVILQRSASDQQAVLGLQGSDDLRKLAGLVFDTMGFVDNQVPV